MKLDFGLSPSNLDEGARKAWGYEFGLIYSVTLGREGLTTSMVVRNEGSEAWEFQVLMHSYFRVQVCFSVWFWRGMLIGVGYLICFCLWTDRFLLCR